MFINTNLPSTYIYVYVVNEEVLPGNFQKENYIQTCYFAILSYLTIYQRYPQIFRPSRYFMYLKQNTVWLCIVYKKYCTV